MAFLRAITINNPVKTTENETGKTRRRLLLEDSGRERCAESMNAPAMPHNTTRSETG